MGRGALTPKGPPFLLFFPTIDLMKRATPLVQELNEDILAVHAADPERKEKVLKLRNKEVPGLLTTTILERGITISNVQVAVIGGRIIDIYRQCTHSDCRPSWTRCSISRWGGGLILSSRHHGRDG